MREESLRFLEKLVSAPSPSGYEQPAQRVFRDYIAPFAQVSTDMLGNVIGFVQGAGENRPKVMLVGHSDEIGFLVRYIDENGFIFFGAIGGIDPQITQGRRVRVHTRQGDVPGVTGRKPIHLTDAKDRETVVKLEAQYIDIGAANKEEAEQLVRIGDPVTFAECMEMLHGGRITARGLDDKAGSFVVAEVLRHISESKIQLTADLYGVSSVQEEVGLRGGKTSAFSINPDVGICVEVDFSTDQPDLDKKSAGDVKLGGGPILPRGANINPSLFEILAQSAESEGIAVQYTGLPRATGTDANVMQISRSGVATALVKIPLRYMHSPVEVLSLSDLENVIKLIASALARIKDKNSFIPS
ncbi:MAG TPA: M42 family metallopeptidase [Geobacteraceae bacterium]|nr:M42 family metallopeptidase [Geobacteraceae bacterium]